MADVPAVGYKNFHCYTAMKEKDRERLDRLVQAYGPILNEGPKQEITRYTSHNFDRHCTDLYRIISMFLLRDTMEQLSKEELYLLNVSVLLHDISMCQGGWEREVNTSFCPRASWSCCGRGRSGRSASGYSRTQPARSCRQILTRPTTD